MQRDSGFRLRPFDKLRATPRQVRIAAASHHAGVGEAQLFTQDSLDYSDYLLVCYLISQGNCETSLASISANLQCLHQKTQIGGISSGHKGVRTPFHPCQWAPLFLSLRHSIRTIYGLPYLPCKNYTPWIPAVL